MNISNLFKVVKKPLLIIAGLIIFYTVLGFLIIPWVIKSKLPEIAHELTGKEVLLSDVKFDPYGLKLIISGFEMNETNGEKIIGLNELFVNYGLWTSIQHRAVSIDEIRLNQPYTDLRINKDGSLNLAGLVKPEDAEEIEEEEESGEVFPLWLGKIIIEQGQVDFSDLSHAVPFHESLEPIDLYIEDITTVKKVKGQDNSFSFAFGSGGKAEWQGDFFLVPNIKSSGKVSLTGLRVNKLWDYIKSYVNFKIQKGSLAVQAEYAFDMADDTFQLTVSDGQAKLTEFSLGPKNSEQSVINIADLSVGDISFDLLDQHLNIATISSDTASFTTEINESGEVNLTELFAGEASQEDSTPPAEEVKPAGKPFLVDVSSLVLNNYLVDVVLQTGGEPVELKLSPIRLEVTDFSTKPGNKFNLNAAITVNESGKIETKGSVGIDPVLVNLDIKANQLALDPFQPYISQSTQLKLVSGSVDLDTKIDLALAENDGIKLNVTGKAGVNNLNTIEVKNKKEFLKWKAVDLKEIKFTLEPMTLDIAAVDVDGIETEFIVNKDRTTNLDEIFSAPAGSSVPEKRKQESSKKDDQPFNLNIGVVNISNSAAFYADHSLIIPFGADIKSLHGSVTKISTARKTRTKINLKGKVNHTAPTLIQGTVEPFDFENHMDILMQFKGIDMTGMTPYMAEFAGYKVEKGKLSVDLHYKINNKELQATNKVVLDQLTLGEEVESPNSVSLPVKLAISLLQDRNGVIDLNLPIEGSLEDPEFSIMGLLGGVMLNIITKAVAAPFTIIAGLVGSDADLSQIIFTAGSAELDAEQKKNLDTLAQGLNERPELKLEVRGVAFKVEDGHSLAEKALMHRFKADVWEDMWKRKRPASIDDIVLSDEDYYDLLSEDYKNKFPEQAKEMINKAEDASDIDTARKIYEQMKQQLVGTETVSDDELDRLANQRGENIMKYLTEQGKIGAERVFLLQRKVLPAAEKSGIAVELKLGAD